MNAFRYLTANYYLKLGKSDDAKGVLGAGILANPSSLLLAYTLAESEEESGEKEACHAIYDGLILHFHTELATLQANTDAEIATAMAVFDDAEVKPEEDLPNGQDVEAFQKTVQEKEEMKVTIRGKNAAAVESAKRAAANVWITQMRFARRAEVSLHLIQFVGLTLAERSRLRRESSKLEPSSQRQENHPT